MLCDDPVVHGKQHCKPCIASLDSYAALLGDGTRRDPVAIIDALGLELVDEDELVAELRSDPRFVEKDGCWTVRSDVRLKWLNTRKAS